MNVGKRAGRGVALTVGAIAALGAAEGRAVEVLVPEAELTVPVYGPVIGSSAGSPSVACHQTACLAAWSEGRPNLGYRVWARRLRVDGTPVDPAAFLLSVDALNTAEPAVATDGARFMVAWSDANEMVFVTRVDPDGSTHTQSVLSGFGFASSARYPAIAFGGDGYLLAFSNRQGAYDGPVNAYRIDRDGHFLDPAPIALVTDSGARGLPDVAWTGNQFLVVWSATDVGGGWAVLGKRVRADGTVLDDPGFLVASFSGFSNRPRLAVGGDTALLVAGRSTESGGGGVDAVLLDRDGRNGRRVALPDTTATTTTGAEAAATWNGGSFVVSWLDGTNQTVVARVRPDGTVLDTTEIGVSDAAVTTLTEWPVVASPGGPTFVVYVDGRANLVRMGSLGADGVVGAVDDRVLNTSAAPQHLLAAARGDGQTLLVWSDELQGSNAAALHAARVADSGARPDGAPIVLSAAGNNKLHASAAAAWGAGVFLVAWWEPDDPARLTGRVQAARVSADGRLLDATPVVLATQLIADQATAVAFGGGNFLVSWTQNGIIPMTTPPPPPLAAALVGPDGKQVGAGFSIGPSMQASYPYATGALGDGYLAAWTRFDGAAQGVQVETISASGTQGAPLSLTAWGSVESLALVPSPTRTLVWLDGRRGVLLTGSDPFTVVGLVDVGGDIGQPAWNASLYVSAAPTSGGLYGNTGVDVHLMSADGASGEPPTTVVDARLNTLRELAVPLEAGRNLIAYSRVVPDGAHGAFRVDFQIVDSQPAPAPASDAGATSDGAMDGGAMDGAYADATADRGARRGSSAGCGCMLAEPAAGAARGWPATILLLAALSHRRQARGASSGRNGPPPR